MDPDSIDDLLLPHSQISRIFKDAMPGTTLNVSREARIALNQATITFINYIAALAHEITTKAKKQTISANDLLSAIQAAEMHDLLPALREALEQFQAEKQAKKVAKSSSAPSREKTPPTVIAPPVPEQPSSVQRDEGEDEDDEEEIDIV